MRVFLLHGLGRTPASMLCIARRLRRGGHRTTQFGYLAAVEKLDAIAERFAERVAHTLAEDATGAGARSDGRELPPYAVVGHSLGAIVARLAAPRLPAGFERFVMLAPPNRAPAAARRIPSNPLLRLLFGDPGRRLAGAELYASLPRPEVPTLVIAGDRGLSAPWLPFRGEPNDGIVRLAETPLPGAALVIVHGGHTFMMNRRDVTSAVLQFLGAAQIRMPSGRPTGRGGCAGAAPAPASSPDTGC